MMGIGGFGKGRTVSDPSPRGGRTATTGIAGPLGWAVAIGFLVTVAVTGPGRAAPTSLHVPAGGADTLSADSVAALVEGSCSRCHNDRRLRGNLSLEAFDAANPAADAQVTERMIRKLRAGMMPPASARRPEPEVLNALAQTLEANLDRVAAEHPNPGRRTFQRLNRAEYEASIRDLLALEIDAGDFLPLDTKSANFDNIADVQLMSPTLMDAYLRAASEISRLAVGDAGAAPAEATFRVSRWTSQMEQVEGAPYGTRGGVSVVHNFPADGEYSFRVSFHHETTGAMHGSGRAALHTLDAPEQIEISVDGERLVLLDIDRWMHVSDPDGVNLRAGPFFIEAGPHRVSAAFIRRIEGPLQDLISPHDWSIASTSIADAYGLTSVPHLRDMAVTGPFDARGVSETPSRQAIFTCRPESENESEACATEILTRIGTQAYRRALTAADHEALMSLFEVGRDEGGFEAGIRLALEGILASPNFVFRFEGPDADAATDEGAFELSDAALASRLSFFLWGAPPDAALLDVVEAGELSDPWVLEREARRMLADPRAEALATRFAGQWLRLQDLEKIHPDVRLEPDFDEQLRAAMLRETELFFHSLVEEDRSILDLISADYTFVNERLARHYGIPGISGPDFQRITYPDDTRRGLLGHGSVLTLTSHAGRTSPVLRGKWVMEVLLGSPPPPPPPDVPELEATAEADAGRMLTVRERMEMHRANPSCNSCHSVIDPIGLALENYGVSGGWRVKDSGAPIDVSGELYDGTPLTSAADLRGALLSRPTPLVRNFVENLMAYALGRRIEYYDMPTVRRIEAEAVADDYRVSAFILGVVRSPAFRMKAVPSSTQATELMESQDAFDHR